MTAKPGSKSTTRKATSASEWKKKSQGQLVELPSGCVMRIRKVGLQTMMQMGIMPNSLISIAQKALDKGSGRPGIDEAQAIELLQDPKKVAEISTFMDKMVMFVATEPKVLPLPADGVERDDDEVYVDDVMEEDKMFIFQLVTGGTSEVESFRDEHTTTMAGIRGRQDLELPAE